MFESLVAYSKVKRINRRYVTHYTIKLTLESIWEVSHYNGPIVTEIMEASVIYL